MTREKKDPEREKGAAPPDYMPAIFGWMSMEDQREHAREIVDFTKDINKNDEKNNESKK